MFAFDLLVAIDFENTDTCLLRTVYPVRIQFIFCYTGVIMVLSASYEFSKRFNSEIVERPSDNIEIPEVGNFIKLKKNFK